MLKLQPKYIQVIWPVLGGLALLLDRATKWYFVNEPGAVIQLIEPYLYLQFHLNTQLALSLPLVTWLYYPVLVVTLAVLSWQWYQATVRKQMLDQLLLTFVLVGAFSNLADRFIYNGVIDFVAISFWSVFNMADVYIVGGIFAWIVVLWQRDRLATKKNNHV